MMGSHSQPKLALTTSSNGPDLPHCHQRDRKLHSRRTVKSALTAGGGLRLRKYCGTPASRSTGLATPFLKWKYKGDGDFAAVGNDVPVTGRMGARWVSTRKLAAGMLQSRSAVEGACGSEGGEFGPYNRLRIELQSPLPFHKLKMEAATKRDTGWRRRRRRRTSRSTYPFYTQIKVLENQQLTTISLIFDLQAALLQAQIRIDKLEAKRQSSKLKREPLLKLLDEQRNSWKRKEDKKIRTIMDDLKEKLDSERKSRKRMEILNSKLVNELSEAKLCAEQNRQDYENERKGRELVEEICQELAKEIGEEKAEVEALKRETMEIHEELEEERKMLRMAEVWREERVRMKLVDAKLALEEKYNQMNNLVSDLETFLGSKISTGLDDLGKEEVESILQGVDSVNIPDINQFSYVPPESSDIFSIIEEVQNGEANDREMKENPHIARGMKGCTEWPRGIQKHDMKSRQEEARVEKQKIQMRHIYL